MPGLEKLTETLLALAPVAVGYFAGWAYLSAYLTAFQIDISEVSLPLATVLIYSYLTVGTGLFLAATLVLVCLAFIPKGRWNLVRLPLMAVGIWGYAWASVEIARSQAEARSYEVWQGAAPEKIAMVETRKGDTIAEEYNRCGRQRRLLSVFNTTELSYVLCRAGDRKPEAGMVYAVAPDGKIRSRRGASNEVSGPIDSPHKRLWNHVADWWRGRPGAGSGGNANG